MARQLSMGQINSILTLHQAGRSNRQIANLLGIHRETVAKHLAAAEVSAKPDPRVQPGPVSACEPLRERILATLEQESTTFYYLPGPTALHQL